MASLADKSLTIHNGVDLSLYDPAIHNRSKAGASLGLNNQWALGLIGRMTDPRGHVYFLETLCDGLKSLPPLKVFFAGGGPNRSILEDTVKNFDLSDAVYFLGVRDDIPRVFAALDVVVTPSLSEGFPYVLLEAVAAGNTVVSSKVNWVGEIITSEDQSFLMQPHRPEERSATIIIPGRE